MRAFTAHVNLCLFITFITLSALALPPLALGQDEATAPIPANATESVEAMMAEDNAGMTLYDLLLNGGWVMGVLAALSILALSLILYFFFTLTERKLVPRDLINQIRHFIKDGRHEDIARVCRRQKGMLSKVVLAGLMRGSSDPNAVASTMETVGRREAETLMRKVRYLSDIATVSPMLGLLGTVLGMISAFNLIAFEISAVKPVALASAVAQALVTTAAGLIVAIPCMGFFYFFRGKLQSLVAEVEEISVEISDSVNARQSQTTTRKRATSKKSAPKKQSGRDDS